MQHCLISHRNWNWYSYFKTDNTTWKAELSYNFLYFQTIQSILFEYADYSSVLSIKHATPFENENNLTDLPFMRRYHPSFVRDNWTSKNNWPPTCRHCWENWIKCGRLLIVSKRFIRPAFTTIFTEMFLIQVSITISKTTDLNSA